MNEKKSKKVEKKKKRKPFLDLPFCFSTCKKEGIFRSRASDTGKRAIEFVVKKRFLFHVCTTIVLKSHF
jgi:hypothetical protein